MGPPERSPGPHAGGGWELQVEAVVLAIQEWCTGCAMEALLCCHLGSSRAMPFSLCAAASSVQKVGWERATPNDARQ